MLSRIVMNVAAMAAALAPGAAAAMPQFDDPGAARRGASVGAYLRLPFSPGGERGARPQIGVRIAMVQTSSDPGAPTAAVRETDALDLRLSGAARPTLLIAGRPVLREHTQRMNALGTAGTVGLVAGGVVLLLVVAVAAGGGGLGDTCPTIEGGRDHCIDP
ncbi:MAG TPA: hypothetical protein VGB54_11860 [Allosphingosinicella sp.]|jgi:hypothetical protein